MLANQLRWAYIKFFQKKGHAHIPSAPLLPEGDSSTLFISAGMHPLVPYLLGEPHPLGKRLVDWQKCLRTEDIEEVGNTSKHTFFEMLGNWSLGDYFKKEAISWSWEFVTQVLRLPKEKIWVTIFAGDKLVPYDQEAERCWRKVGLSKERIIPLGREDNWWEAGETGPGGPDTEIFVDTGKRSCGPTCRPGCKCGKYVEIWNNVFMEYNRQKDGSYQPLKQKNVDTGMGLERTTAVLQGHNDNYQIELLRPLISLIEELAGKQYQSQPETTRFMRIIVDHLRAATFVLAEKITPSNVTHGYVLRRLIRRAVRFGKLLGIKKEFAHQLGKRVIRLYQEIYPELGQNQEFIVNQLITEEQKFLGLLNRGLSLLQKELARLKNQKKPVLPAKFVFDLYQTWGFPPELTLEEAKRILPNVTFNQEELAAYLRQHQEKSRQASKKLFRGGLAETNPQTIRLHTATHLLQAAARQILGPHVHQVGSAITPDKLRFDFTHPSPLTPDQLQKIQDWVNEKIRAGLPVYFKVMPLKTALKIGALTIPNKQYPSQVKVYFIGRGEQTVSIEVCGGPHVRNTKELGQFQIIKEESCGAGKRRIYGILKV